MLLNSSRNGTTCDGASRRDFLKVGVLGASALALPGLLKARAEAKTKGQPTRNTSVVWLWLGGGPTHIETFDPKMTAPAEFRSVVGALKTNVPAVVITAPEEVRAARTHVAVEQRSGRLIPDAEKVRRADFAFVNDGTLEELDLFVVEVLGQLRK